MSDRIWKSIGQDSLKDGSWVCYLAEFEDTRDIMSDLVKPSYSRSGKYEIRVMKPNKRNSSDASIQITVDKKAGNWIAYLIRKNVFKNYQEFSSYLESFCKKLHTYKVGHNIVEWYGEITRELSLTAQIGECMNVKNR